MTTPKHIISTVAFTLAALLTCYVVTLCAVILIKAVRGEEIDREALTHLQSAGQTLMGTFTGMLINTRTPAQPTTESTQTISTTTTESDPKQ